jgi:putative transposase
MIIHKAFRFKLKPTRAQEAQFWRYAGASRWVWNEMFAYRQRVYGATGQAPSTGEQMARLTAIKGAAETAWLREIHSQVLQEPLKHLADAFGRFFKGVAGFPNFKSKRRTTPSFSYPQSVQVHENQGYLPKIGWVRVRKSRDVVGLIKRATVSHKVSGWYVSILCEVEVADPAPPHIAPETTVGIDLGLIDFLTPSEGEPIPAPRFLRRLEKKLAQTQRALARCQRGSKRYQKQARKVARLHERVANARRDFLHKLSSAVVAENQGIFAEDLSVKGLARTRLAKSVHDAGWGEFLRQLEYKCTWQGKLFHQVKRFFPSSKLHGEQADGTPCGHLNTLSLSDRTFICQGCGEFVHRDRNAAQNMKRQGLLDVLAAGQTDSLNARGLEIRPVSTGALE